jgi:hypothetical protein
MIKSDKCSETWKYKMGPHKISRDRIFAAAGVSTMSVQYMPTSSSPTLHFCRQRMPRSSFIQFAEGGPYKFNVPISHVGRHAPPNTHIGKCEENRAKERESRCFFSVSFFRECWFCFVSSPLFSRREQDADVQDAVVKMRYDRVQFSTDNR